MSIDEERSSLSTITWIVIIVVILLFVFGILTFTKGPGWFGIGFSPEKAGEAVGGAVEAGSNAVKAVADEAGKVDVDVDVDRDEGGNPRADADADASDPNN